MKLKPSSLSSSSSTSSALIRKSRLSPYLFVLLAFILFVSVLYGEDFRCILSPRLPTDSAELSGPVLRTGELTQSASGLCPGSLPLPLVPQSSHLDIVFLSFERRLYSFPPINSSCRIKTKNRFDAQIQLGLCGILCNFVMSRGTEWLCCAYPGLDQKVEDDREEEDATAIPFALGRTAGGRCDLFSGRWVRDELTRPLYQESDCPYIQPQLTCQEHGRPDRGYQFWRWQPHSCSLPRSILSLFFSQSVIFYLLKKK